MTLQHVVAVILIMESSAATMGGMLLGNLYDYL